VEPEPVKKDNYISMELEKRAFLEEAGTGKNENGSKESGL
jgi:hypothetical protein